MTLFISRLKSIPLYTLAILVVLYFVGAIYYDGPMNAGSLGNMILALLWVALIIYLFKSKFPPKKKYSFILLAFAVVIIPWSMISASNDRDWQPEFSETAWVDIQGKDTLTFHQCRNFIHTSEGSTEQWETRIHHLSKLKGMDLFFDAFGGETLAHTMISFDFGDEGRLCLSIESRREKGEQFTPLGGLYKMFELQYIFGSEEDLVGLRTNIREEPVFLYRLNVTPEQCRNFLMESINAANTLHKNPKFYNVISANCTTSYRAQTPEGERSDFDWRMLLNGYLDSYLFEKNTLVTDGLSFEDYNKQAKINAAANAVTDRIKFSSEIRENRVGF